MSRRNWASIAATISLLILPAGASAVIKNLIPLRNVLNSEQMIFEAKVEKIDPDKPAIWLKPGDVWKGKLPFTRMPVNMTGDAEAQREKQTPQLLKRLAPDLGVVMFVSKKGSRYLAFAYSNGTWFQMEGRGDSDDKLTWSFLHGEPYLRRTFKGTTEEIKQAIKDGLAGKEVPGPDEKAEPGFGPEIESKDKPAESGKPLAVGSNQFTVGPPLGVAPTFLLIGPLALLATLFPTVFGGLALLMKRWMVAMSVCCTASTIYFLHGWFFGRLEGTWFGSTVSLWLVMALLSAVGAVWAGRRYRRAMETADHETFTYGHWDRRVLVLLSIIGVVPLVFAFTWDGPYFYLITKEQLLRSPRLDLIAFSFPVWVGIAVAYANRSLSPQRSPSVEAAFIWALVFSSSVVCALEFGRAEKKSPIQVASSIEGRVPRPVGIKWERGLDADGAVYATPLPVGDRVYVAAARAAGLTGQDGIVLALDANTGDIVWTFDNDQEMKPVFCSPVLSDGRIYIGEGFHENKDCKLFCLDAKNGKKIWQFQTQSHTESTPLVVDGKVYFGAGDDGIYCVDAVKGEKIWNYTGVHVDSTPVVADSRLYVGSGVGDIQKTTLLLCLDANTGKEIWRLPVEVPAFASPALSGKHVFFGIGNGDFSRSGSPPIGAVVCVEAASGKQVWRFDAPDAVLSEPAVDADSVHVVCRDTNTQIFCLNRTDGTTRWKKSFGSPIVAAPALIGGETEFGSVPSLYVASTAGLVQCLNPSNGEPYWTLDLTKTSRFDGACVNATPVVRTSREAGVEHRLIFLGAQLSHGQTTVPRWYCFEDEVR
jgi:outer membrane protein assembly factor BamB